MFGRKRRNSALNSAYAMISAMARYIGIEKHNNVENVLNQIYDVTDVIVSDAPHINVEHMVTDMPPTWGYHVLIDCKGCRKEIITNGDMLKKFVRDLVLKIDMKAYGQPVIEHFATHDIEKGGYTIMQMIETSSIVGHFVDSTGDCYLDIFSCKPFNVDDAYAFVSTWLTPEKMNLRLLRRQA